MDLLLKSTEEQIAGAVGSGVELDFFDMIKKYYRGPFVGIPYELRLSMRQGNGPDGKKRTYPVFSFTMKPRGGIKLSSDNFAQLVSSGNQAAKAMALPAPRDATLEDDLAFAHLGDVEKIPRRDNGPQDNTAADNAKFEHNRRTAEVPNPEAEQLAEKDDAADADFRDIEVSEKTLRQAEHNKDEDKMIRQWHGAVRGTFLDPDEARHDFLARHVDGISSLKEVVKVFDQAGFDELIVIAQAEIAHRSAEAAEQAKLADPVGWHESITPRHARQLVELVRLSGLKRTEVYLFITMVTKNKVHDRAQVTAEDVDAVLRATGTLQGEGWTYNEARTADRLIDFASWQTSDEAALGVL